MGEVTGETDLFQEDSRVHVVGGRGEEWGAGTEELVEEDTELPPVGFETVAGTVDHFGGHVFRGAAESLRPRVTLHKLAKVHITELDMA